MVVRPYQHMRVDELERLFADAPQNVERLHAILTELGFRSTSRALDLKRRLEHHLKVGRKDSTDKAASTLGRPSAVVRAQRAQPAPGDEVNLESGGTNRDAQQKRPIQQEIRGEPMVANSKARVEAMSEPLDTLGQLRSSKPELSPTQRGVSQLIEYVRVLVDLAGKPVWSLSSYSNVVLHEDNLRNRIGIRHDLTDADGPIFLKIDRLRRTDPPEVPSDAIHWLTVGRDPFKEPIVQSLRTAIMTAAEAERLMAEGTVDSTDVTKTLKLRPGEDLRDVVLRLDRFPNAKTKVDDYLARAWAQWAQAERPRRETIDIYDRLFSLQQALKLGGADRPLEVVWGTGVARWKVPPNELDHPVVEQLVELELDEAGALLVRPRGVDPIMAIKPYAAMENPGTDLVARFAREHFAKLPPTESRHPF